MAASAFGGSARRGTRHRGAAPIGRGRAGAANGRLAFLGLALVGGFGAVEGLAFREVAVWLRAFVRYGAFFFLRSWSGADEEVTLNCPSVLLLSMSSSVLGVAGASGRSSMTSSFSFFFSGWLGS